MHTVIKDVYFSAYPNMQKSIVKKLNLFGIYIISQLADYNNFDLFKIRSLGFGKFSLIQNAMMKHGVIFKNGYLRMDAKYSGKFLQKHGVEL